MFTTLEYLGLIPSILHLSLTSAVEDPCPFVAFVGTGHMWYTYLFGDKIPIPKSITIKCYLQYKGYIF